MATNDVALNAPSADSSDCTPIPCSSVPADDAELTIPDARDFPLLQLAYQTFLRDLPELLQKYPDQFVAYEGDVQLGIAESPWELETRVAKLPLGTGAVFTIAPESEIDQGAEAGPLF